MASALTRTQMEILHRLRDRVDLATSPWIPGLLREVSFLRALGLVDLQSPFQAELTNEGRMYLAAADLEVVQVLDPTRDAASVAEPFESASRTEGADRELIMRLDNLVAQAMQRCASIERAIAAGLASGFDTSTADAALAASYRALRLFKEKLASAQALRHP